MSTLPTFDQIVENLEDIDWFEGFTDEAKQLALKTLRKNHREMTRRADEAEPYTAQPAAWMISVWGDAECVYEEDSYTTVLKDFAEGSFGLFLPKQIQEEWDDEVIHFSFRVGDKTYRTEIPFEGSDYLEPEIFEVINKAAGELSPPMTFTMPAIGWGQDFGYVLSSVPAQRRAIDAGLLIPESMGEDFEEPDTQDGDEPLPDTAGEFLDWLDTHHWFYDMPEAYVCAARSGVMRTYDAGRHPATGLAIIDVDLKTVTEISPDWVSEQIRSVADGSHGMTPIDHVAVEDIENGWQIIGKHDGKEYKSTVFFEMEGDTIVRDDYGNPSLEDDLWLSIGVLFQEIQEGSGRRFKIHHFTDEQAVVHFLPHAANNDAIQSSWFPSDLEGIIASMFEE